MAESLCERYLRQIIEIIDLYLDHLRQWRINGGSHFIIYVATRRSRRPYSLGESQWTKVEFVYRMEVMMLKSIGTAALLAAVLTGSNAEASPKPRPPKKGIAVGCQSKEHSCAVPPTQAYEEGQERAFCPEGMAVVIKNVKFCSRGIGL